MEIVKTNKGGNMLIYDGYQFTAKNKGGVSIRWSCIKNRSDGCKGAVSTDHGMTRAWNVVVHNHERDHTEIELTKFRNEMKENARRFSNSKTADILSASVGNLTPDAMLSAPNKETLKRDIQRKKAAVRPLEPVNRQDIQLGPPWTQTLGVNPMNFLIHDSGIGEPNRILVFAADDALHNLSVADTWYMDGNFKSAPSIFKQVYVIRCKLDSGAISCVYSLLPSKDMPTYEELFRSVLNRLNQMGLQVHVRMINLDFEEAAYTAFLHVFGPNIYVNGCFFHLTKNTLKKATELGLRQYIIESSPTMNREFRRFAGMIDALAFVPVGHLNIAVQVLRNNVPDPIMQPLLDYFLQTYVNGRGGQPQFPPQVWNKFQITLDGNARTNNICEGWNRKFNLLNGNIRNPAFFKVLDTIQKDHKDVQMAIMRSQNGTPLTQRVTHATRQYNRNVTNLCRAYHENQYQGNVLGYLYRLSGNIRFKD